MTQNRFRLTREAAAALMAQPVVEEAAFACDVDQRDAVRVSRRGDAGSGLAARGIVLVGEGGRYSKVYLAAPELRSLAAAILNVADAIDGTTPLVFFPPDAPETEEPQIERGSE